MAIMAFVLPEILKFNPHSFSSRAVVNYIRNAADILLFSFFVADCRIIRGEISFINLKSLYHRS